MQTKFKLMKIKKLVLNYLQCAGSNWWVNSNAKDGNPSVAANERPIDESYNSADKNTQTWGFGTLFFDDNGEGLYDFAQCFYWNISDPSRGNGVPSLFNEKQLEALKKALETFKTEYNGASWNKGQEVTASDGRVGRNFATSDIIDYILAAYKHEAEKAGVNNFIDNKFYIENDDYRAWEKKKDNTEKECNNKSNEYAQIFTNYELEQLNFYNKIFSSIAEKGWTNNPQINNADYLNQTLQNNLYTLTSISSEEVETTECNDCGEKIFKLRNSYSTDIASNFSQIFIVNDSDLREQAMVEYEYEKSIINQKESRIDTRMQDLKTEQSAINQMLQGLDKVKNENIERTMNIFG